MTAPTVSLWAVVLATGAAMVVGSVWHSPRVLGTYWMSKARVGRDEAVSRGVWPVIVTVAAGLVTAWVLAGAAAIANNHDGGSFLLDAVATAAVLWLGFTAARFLTHDALEGRPPGLTAVNLAHELVTVLVMALVIGTVGR